MTETSAVSAPKPNDEKEKSKKPSDSAFKQQRLPAWQPVMTAKSVIPTFIVIGIIFIPVGAVLYDYAHRVREEVIDYTACDGCYDKLNTTGAHEPDYVVCTCIINFTLSHTFDAPVYMYYGLDNFYQNHRRYVKSRDDSQLLGKSINPDDLSKDCDPFRKFNATHSFVPCGAIANSLFNDTFALLYEGKPINLIRKGIAWDTDKSSKFKNPVDSPSDLCSSAAFKNTVKPPNWPKELCRLDNETDNNGFQNEDLIVWMRTAALPNFRKLYRKIEHTDVFKEGLPKGNYTVVIDYNYPVKSFDGRKKFILSTVSWIGGKNPFLGIAYMVVGCICIVLGVVFAIVHFKIAKKSQEVTDVTDRTPYLPH